MCKLILTFGVHIWKIPVSILHKSIEGRYRPVKVADGPITARCRFIKNASWDIDPFITLSVNYLSYKNMFIV